MTTKIWADFIYIKSRNSKLFCSYV